MIDPRAPDYANTPVSSARPPGHYTPHDPAAAPLVSVITPYFNTGPVFHETARSIFNQSLQRWEWLIVDDGTTDPEALQVLETYRQKGSDPRIRVLSLDRNLGPGGARNYAVAQSRAPYILPLDADDLIEPTTLEKCLWFLESFSEYAFVKGHNVGFGEQEYLWTGGFHSGARILHENVGTIVALIRRSVFQAVGGFDESLRQGNEDWDFWLRCADRGHWGGLIPEYFDWYRRRPSGHWPWEAIDLGERQAAFRRRMQERYPRLYAGGFPHIQPQDSAPYAPLRPAPPVTNPLRHDRPRLLMILPWLTMGGADKFNRDLVEQLTRRGWDVSIATTLSAENVWLPDFARFTPDIFVLPRFLKQNDYPLFLRYLIESRTPDVVLVSNSELAYTLLPYLRAHCPAPAYVDYCHMEEEYWKSGGYPRYAVAYQPQLDLNIVASRHLKRWLEARGADPQRVEVATINVDPDAWTPDPKQRAAVRTTHRISDGTPVLLYAARLCPQKKPRVFAAVMKALAARGLDFVALVAGNGEDEPWLREYIAHHRLKNHVRMLGAVPSDAMPGLMAAADVFFLSSLWEGIALAIYEAMSAGLAIVGADVGGQRELVTPECGTLITPGDDEAESAAYTEILADLLADPARIRAMGARGRARIQAEFPLDRMGDRMVELLDQAQAWQRRAPRAGIGPALAGEYATLGLEYARTNTQLDEIWHRHVAMSAGTAVVTRAAIPRINSGLLAAEELECIENSRFWRLTQRLKRSPVYRWAARLRFGPDWDRSNLYLDPQQRLDEIKGSRAYRLIRAVKRTALYRWYARRKYGPGFDQTPFDQTVGAQPPADVGAHGGR